MVGLVLQYIQHIVVTFDRPVEIFLFLSCQIHLTAHHSSRSGRARVLAGSVFVQLPPVYTSSASLIPTVIDQIAPYHLCLCQITHLFRFRIPVDHIEPDPYVIIVKAFVTGSRVAGISQDSTIQLTEILYSFEHHIIHCAIDILHFALFGCITHSDKCRKTAALSPDQRITIPITFSIIWIITTPAAPGTLAEIISNDRSHVRMCTVQHLRQFQFRLIHLFMIRHHNTAFGHRSLAGFADSYGRNFVSSKIRNFQEIFLCNITLYLYDDMSRREVGSTRQARFHVPVREFYHIHVAITGIGPFHQKFILVIGSFYRK